MSEILRPRLPNPINLGGEHHFTVHHGLLLRREYGGFLIPDFQRGLVWTQDQKRLFIESIYLKLPIGSYCYHETINTGVEHVLLDGQQRWSAIFDYMDSKFPVFGLLYSELTLGEVCRFENSVFMARIVRGMTHEEQREVFERLAYGGTPNVRPEPNPSPSQQQVQGQTKT